MNFGQMANRVMDATLRGGNLTGGNRDQVKEDINEAIKEVDAILRPLTVVTTVSLVANQQDYSLHDDFAITDVSNIRDVIYLSPNNPGISQNLLPSSPEYIRELRRTFTYSTYVALWALDGLDLFMIYPATQSTGDTITLYCNADPVDLLNETDVPVGLPSRFHDVYVLFAIQRSMRQSSPEYSAQYVQMSDKRIADYRKWRNHRDGAVARKVTVGRPGRRLVPHDNSADWR